VQIVLHFHDRLDPFNYLEVDPLHIPLPKRCRWVMMFCGHVQNHVGVFFGTSTEFSYSCPTYGLTCHSLFSLCITSGDFVDHLGTKSGGDCREYAQPHCFHCNRGTKPVVGQIHYHQISLVDPSKGPCVLFKRSSSEMKKGEGGHIYGQLAEAPLTIEGFFGT